jgi:hypothetical protein
VIAAPSPVEQYIASPPIDCWIIPIAAISTFGEDAPGGVETGPSTVVASNGQVPTTLAESEALMKDLI